MSTDVHSAYMFAYKWQKVVWLPLLIISFDKCFFFPAFAGKKIHTLCVYTFSGIKLNVHCKKNRRLCSLCIFWRHLITIISKHSFHMIHTYSKLDAQHTYMLFLFSGMPHVLVEKSVGDCMLTYKKLVDRERNEQQGSPYLSHLLQPNQTTSSNI